MLWSFDTRSFSVIIFFTICFEKVCQMWIINCKRKKVRTWSLCIFQHTSKICFKTALFCSNVLSECGKCYFIVAKSEIFWVWWKWVLYFSFYNSEKPMVDENACIDPWMSHHCIAFLSYPESINNGKNTLFGTFPIRIRSKMQGFSKDGFSIRRITKKRFQIYLSTCIWRVKRPPAGIWARNTMVWH